MNTTTTKPAQFAPSAAVNGVATKFTPAHRGGPFAQTPVVASLALSVPMAHEDLVAALFYYVDGTEGDPDVVADMANDDLVRLYAVDAAINAGLAKLDEIRAEIANMVATADPMRWEWLELCRHRTTEVFGPDVPAPRRRPRRAAARRDLVNA